MYSHSNCAGGVSVSLRQYRSGQLPGDGWGQVEWWYVNQPEFDKLFDATGGRWKLQSRRELNDKNFKWYVTKFRRSQWPGRNQERKRYEWRRGQYFIEHWRQVRNERRRHGCNKHCWHDGNEHWWLFKQ